MTGMVFGSIGTPLAPWQALHICALASISPCACAGALRTAATAAIVMVVVMTVETQRANMVPPGYRSGSRMPSSIRRWRAGAIGRTARHMVRRGLEIADGNDFAQMPHGS